MRKELKIYNIKQFTEKQNKIAKQLDETLKKNNMIAFCAENGSGKSSFLKKYFSAKPKKSYRFISLSSNSNNLEDIYLNILYQLDHTYNLKTILLLGLTCIFIINIFYIIINMLFLRNNFGLLKYINLISFIIIILIIFLILISDSWNQLKNYDLKIGKVKLKQQNLEIREFLFIQSIRNYIKLHKVKYLIFEDMDGQNYPHYNIFDILQRIFVNGKINCKIICCLNHKTIRSLMSNSSLHHKLFDDIIFADGLIPYSKIENFLQGISAFNIRKKFLDSIITGLDLNQFSYRQINGAFNFCHDYIKFNDNVDDEKVLFLVLFFLNYSDAERNQIILHNDILSFEKSVRKHFFPDDVIKEAEEKNLIMNNSFLKYGFEHNYLIYFKPKVQQSSNSPISNLLKSYNSQFKKLSTDNPFFDDIEESIINAYFSDLPEEEFNMMKNYVYLRKNIENSKQHLNKDSISLDDFMKYYIFKTDNREFIKLILTILLNYPLDMNNKKSLFFNYIDYDKKEISSLFKKYYFTAEFIETKFGFDFWLNKISNLEYKEPYKEIILKYSDIFINYNKEFKFTDTVFYDLKSKNISIESFLNKTKSENLNIQDPSLDHLENKFDNFLNLPEEYKKLILEELYSNPKLFLMESDKDYIQDLKIFYEENYNSICINLKNKKIILNEEDLKKVFINSCNSLKVNANTSRNTILLENIKKYYLQIEEIVNYSEAKKIQEQIKLIEEEISDNK